jgi:hypothetical protein
MQLDLIGFRGGPLVDLGDAPLERPHHRRSKIEKVNSIEPEFTRRSKIEKNS